MINHKEITNKKEWESFLESSGLEVSFFQSWHWGEFESSLNKKIIRIGFYEDNKLVSLGLGVYVNAKRGKYLHFRNGPVLDWSKEALTNRVINTLTMIAQKNKCHFLRISPLIQEAKLVKDYIKNQGFVKSQMHDVDAELTWVLDLNQPEAQMLSNMRKMTRYSIRKAEKLGVKIENVDNDIYFDEFWNVYQDTVDRHKWSAYSKEYIKKEFSIFAKENSARMFVAKYNGKIISASIFIYYLNQSYYHHSGSLSEYKKVPASYLLQWEAIKYAKKRGLKEHNFFGIAPEDKKSHPWQGLTFFKKGFGGYEKKWMHAHDKPLNMRYYFVNLFERFERKKRGY